MFSAQFCKKNGKKETLKKRKRKLQTPKTGKRTKQAYLQVPAPLLYHPPVGRKKTPRAALAIPACGVGNPRVRRLRSPRAAFEIPACGVWHPGRCTLRISTRHWPSPACGNIFLLLNGELEGVWGQGVCVRERTPSTTLGKYCISSWCSFSAISSTVSSGESATRYWAMISPPSQTGVT